ncbi:MAG: DUF4390 domain-containing protein [Nitrospina sp.]|nr:DUF4390 domain-containing protein [Nitrospina sp.]MBT6716291.1 DUF4390 domain-containing protein [Nitrospina sp.]
MKHLIISKIKRINPFLILGFFILLSVPIPSVFAESPNIVNIGVATKGKYVVMNARLIDGFNDKVLEAIESGVPMGFTYEIELRKENAAWVDSLISSNTVRHKIQYDSLKKAYRFSEVGKNVRRKVITRKTSRYQKLMLTLKDIPIAPIFRLDPNEKYYVRVKADLETDRFWFPFNYIFFFVPFSDFETSWAQTSPLSIDPDIELSKQASDQDSGTSEGKVSRDVIRSFNK